MFMRHDIQHHLVCFIHAFRANLGQIADTQINVIFNNSFYGTYTLSFHCEYRREYSRSHSTGHLQRTARLYPSQIIPVRLAIMF